MVSFNELVLPSSAVLQSLDKAHEQGFRAFLSSIGHDPTNPIHCQRASVALMELRGSLNRDDGPDYQDRYVAAAYIVSYHLQHCILAYLSFRRLFNQAGVPELIYVFDVAAGTGAGRVGLAIALSELRQTPVVYFDSFDPSQPMRSAGNAFWRFFRESIPDARNYTCREFTAVPKRVTDIPDNAFRVVTGFHPSLPWNDGIWHFASSHAMESIRQVLLMVSPDAELFTCHSNKNDALISAMGKLAVQPSSIEIPDFGGVESASHFYTNCAVQLGFEVSNGTSVSRWSRYRFSSPKGVLLVRTTSRQERARLVEQERKAAEQAKRTAIRRAVARRAAREREAERERQLAAEKAERERQRKVELERLAAERAEQERLRKVELERLAAERAEQERLRKAEADRLAAEKAERERQLRAEREREAARRAEEDRQRKEAREQLWSVLATRRDSSEIISAAVVDFNTGGLMVTWEGLEGFVPFSHCRDIVPDKYANLSGLVGRSFDFNVQEVERARDRFVLTRKEIREQSVRETLSRFTAGQILEGDVVRIAVFGAFVRVADGADEYEGLVHISELSRGRVERVSDVVTLGQQVQVRVLKIDFERSRLSLSIKDALPDPWDNITTFIQVGEIRSGEVTNIRDFGLFVRIGERLEGLVHVSKLGGWKTADFQRGDTVQVEIIGIEPERKRIPLRLVAIGS